MKTNLEDILSGISTEAIYKAILLREEGEPEMADFDFESAQELVWLAAEKWLARDLAEFKIDSIERESIVNGRNAPFKYIADMAGEIVGIKTPFDKYQGARVICDWKTSRNTLGTEWKDRLLASWQWKAYSHFEDAKLFIYRGLSRNGDTREVIIEVPETNDEEVVLWINSVYSEINALKQGKFKVWPRNMPSSCHAYGRPCEYIEDCQNYTMPQMVPPEKTLSYSYMTLFQLCNEKARRYAINEGNNSSEESNFGKRVHAGLAELWRQAYNLEV